MGAQNQRKVVDGQSQQPGPDMRKAKLKAAMDRNQALLAEFEQYWKRVEHWFQATFGEEPSAAIARTENALAEIAKDLPTRLRAAMEKQAFSDYHAAFFGQGGPSAGPASGSTQKIASRVGKSKRARGKSGLV